ncbi:hypothetical protein LX86_008239 [Lentzea aerocolonigenes]|nr:hypothetical protein [Lentzea aerocolonigenes]
MINWPQLIVDSLDERLDVTGFRLGVRLRQIGSCGTSGSNSSAQWSEVGHWSLLMM